MPCWGKFFAGVQREFGIDRKEEESIYSVFKGEIRMAVNGMSRQNKRERSALRCSKVPCTRLCLLRSSRALILGCHISHWVSSWPATQCHREGPPTLPSILLMFIPGRGWHSLESNTNPPNLPWESWALRSEYGFSSLRSTLNPDVPTGCIMEPVGKELRSLDAILWIPLFFQSSLKKEMISDSSSQNGKLKLRLVD